MFLVPAIDEMEVERKGMMKATMMMTTIAMMMIKGVEGKRRKAVKRGVIGPLKQREEEGEGSQEEEEEQDRINVILLLKP